jgi:hypothetical protein
VPLPPDLTLLQRAEYTAFLEALASIETEWRSVTSGEDPELQASLAQLDEDTTDRKALADGRHHLLLEVIDCQAERETERVKVEGEESRSVLGDRLAKAYSHTYQSLVAELKDAGGESWESYAEKGAEFPQVQNDAPMRTRKQEPEEEMFRDPQDERDMDDCAISALFEAGDGDDES